MNSFRNFLLRALIRLLLNRRSTIEKSRAHGEWLSKWQPTIPADVVIEKVNMDGLPAEWIYTAEANREKVILYLHGGGYVTGSINSHRTFCTTLARYTGVKILIIEYRLAPEHPFPAGLEDAKVAYRWLLTKGFQAENIVVAGDSAGGGLSLATTLALRDEKQPLPAGVVCISPWADLTMSGASYRLKEKAEAVLTISNLKLWVESYTDVENLSNPMVSPVFADFGGFPPLLIQVGSEEILLDDARLVTEKSQSDGVDVTLSIYDEMWHVWHMLGDMLPEGRAAFEEIGKFIRNV